MSTPHPADRAPAEHPADGRAPWSVILPAVAFGVSLRALLLVLARPLEIQSDEANYLYLALGLEHFGVYLDQHRYLWPPAYPWLLGKAISAFGQAGPDAVRWLQVLASGVVGASAMLFTWRLFSVRAALVCGVLWALHLPLAAYTHLLWSEPLFLALLLPGLWQVLRAIDAGEGAVGGSVQGRLLLGGLLLGAALWVKEWPLFLLPLLAAVVLARSLRHGGRVALQRATLLPLTALVVTLPWTLRNHEVYGRITVAGATLGENTYIGLNGRYMNFDVRALRKPLVSMGLEPIESRSRRGFVERPRTPEGKPVPDWPRREDVVHPLDRQSAQLREGLGFAAAHPGWTLRTRLKKLSDLVTPMSFFTRTYALERYPEGSALNGWLRGPLSLYAFVFSAALMLLGAGGYFLTLPRGPGRDVVTVTLLYVLATGTLVAMSRFRVPAEPFLLVLASGLLAHGPVTRSLPRIAGAGAAACALAALWWVSMPETVAVARLAMGVPS